MSLQSGCTETLKRMNRRYAIEEFKIIVERLRNAYNDVILTTDIIVGFPGETDEEFQITYEFLKNIKFYLIFFIICFFPLSILFYHKRIKKSLQFPKFLLYNY